VDVPAELQRLIRQTVSDPGSVLPREEMESVPQWTMRAIVAAVLPAHEAMVRAKVTAEQAEWLPEILHCVWGFAMREHEGPLPQLVPGHAEEALRHVPGHVLDAAIVARGKA
jgi:hypothetical protein